MKESRFTFTTSWPVLVVAMIGLSCLAGQAAAGAEVPESKQTSLGLYATAAEAFAAWEAAPEEVTILDVRSPEEFILVGHPEMAWNVPLLLQTLEWDEEKGRFAMEPNPYFVAEVKEIASPADRTVYVICRSGGRSAMAVDKLAEAGFTNAFSVIDGMEGDKVKDESSSDFGHRTINGWKNSGLPWTYSIDRERMRLPVEE